MALYDKVVKILKPDCRPNTWYNDKIGQTFDLVKLIDGGYLVHYLEDSKLYTAWVNKGDASLETK